ncbi:hypothetical protein NIES4075_55920 [Tolypothrix sp. NIES-4075]|uniref:class I SAM-dependent methyltransferase n=1 Tax=Tolypothrix sp. NIES-4075 TaxID=2005459 RepID=UPI000B5C55A4|nr:class I SAM-dependent methyltransferase [Tolypothrix sp. NIES-4075]GAX44573.1 hypothetical protein NIES4075_55920 [Tolypothrix sp. NIES-4075]
MLTVRNNNFREHEGILYYLNDAILTESDQKEIVAHKNFEEFRAVQSHKGNDIFDAIAFRSPSINTFSKLMSRLQLSGNETVLEMGGGFCWASALIKREYPNSYVVGSDLILSNLQYTEKFEKILNTHLDEKWVFHCCELPFEAEQFDRIFAFEAFHHFGEKNDFSKTLNEMIRVLKPQGKIILLHEPTSPKYLYNWAYKRVNSNPYAEEDVLVLSKIKQHVTSQKCNFSVEFYPDYEHRGFTESIYYYTLSKLGILQKLLPCSVNIFIEKN